MTEEEAKTKLCVHQPFVRLTVTKTGEAVQAYHEPRCVGSACMAWRATDNEGGPRRPDQPEPVVYQPAGYCGLAGKS